MLSVVGNRAVRLALVAAVAAGLGLLLWLHGPSWDALVDAFTLVHWEWVVAAIGLNLASTLVRAVAWTAVINQSMPPPHPRFMHVFSAFCVGLFGNAVLPGRVGELARVAVLRRKLPEREGLFPTLIGTVFAHRVFDLVAAMALILFVVMTARIPEWAVTSFLAIVGVGVAAVTTAVLIARDHSRSVLAGLGAARRTLRAARHGLGVMHKPGPALVALVAQLLGWTLQLLAVWVAMRAFDIHKSLPVAGLVLVLMNVAILFPLWPGNIGLVQAAVALPLVTYGVAKAKGIAFGFGLQAIEASVGVGVGLLFLAREGLSFAMLRGMPDVSRADVPEDERTDSVAEAGHRARARVPG